MRIRKNAKQFQKNTTGRFSIFLIDIPRSIEMSSNRNQISKKFYIIFQDILSESNKIFEKF